MTQNPSAVLFYARDFLSVEFPKLATQGIQDHPRVYVVTKRAEVDRVKHLDPAGHIFNVAQYIDAARTQPIQRDAVFHDMHKRVYRDRYMSRMTPDEIAPIISGVRNMLEDIGQQFHILIYLDEPVSGFINANLNQWVKDQGGLPCHFHTTWAPGHIFFVSDPAQEQPVTLNLMSDGPALIADHIEKRQRDEAKPSYLHNYNSPIRTLKESARFGAMGVYRRLRNAEIFVDSDPWPHDFQSRSLRASLFGRYTPASEIQDMKDTNFVVFPMHYEPEAVISYYSDFVNQLDLVTQIFQKLPEDTYLLLKEHPSQPGAAQLPKWKELRQNRRVKVIKGSVKMADLLALNTIVGSIGSTAVLESVMKGRTAYVFGAPHFARMPGIVDATDMDALSLTWDAEPTTHAQMADWYGRFMDRHAIKGQFMRGRTFVEDPKALLTALLKAAQ